MKIAAIVLGAALIAGCTASGADVQPPRDQLFFPTGLAVDPQETALFSANSNSELRYDSGTVLVLDLQAILARATAWTTNGTQTTNCTRDPDHPESLLCADEKEFILADRGVRTGNFATEIGVQTFGTQATTRLFVPTRGDPSIAWMDYDGNKLSCSTETGVFQQCDDTHRLVEALQEVDDNNVLLTDEPFGVFADGDDTGRGFAVISHQTNGAVTLVDSPLDGAVRVTDIKFNVFLADQLTGLRGSTGVAGRRPNAADPATFRVDNDIVYVSSRTDSKMQTFTVGRPQNTAPPYFLTGDLIALDQVGAGVGAGGSLDSRGVKFSADGNRMYLLTRTPPALQLYDTTIDPNTGAPRNTLTGASDICRNSSTLSLINFAPATGDTTPTPGVPATVDERAYLSCFDDGVVYVVDPTGTTSVEDIIQVGRGPFAIATAPKAQLVFVSNFLEDTIAVIDVNPLSRNRNRVVLRIGTPKVPTV